MFAERRYPSRTRDTYDEGEKCTKYSGAAIAAFVIVGIIVLGILVLIILAVALPARVWNGGSDKPHPHPHQNHKKDDVVVGSSPAAVTFASGMRGLNLQAPRVTEQNVMGTTLRDVQLPQSTSNIAVRALTPQGNAPLMINMMGSLVQLPSGTVTSAAPSNMFDEVPHAHSIKNNPLEAHLSSVGTPLLVSPTTLKVQATPTFVDVAQGLGADTFSQVSQPGNRASGASHGMADASGASYISGSQHGSGAQHGMQHSQGGKFAIESEQELVSKFNEMHSKQMPVVVSAVSEHCGHCKVFKQMMAQHPNVILVNMQHLRNMGLSGILGEIKQKLTQSNGVPVSVVCQGSHISKAIPGRMSLEDLMKHATK